VLTCSPLCLCLSAPCLCPSSPRPASSATTPAALRICTVRPLHRARRLHSTSHRTQAHLPPTSFFPFNVASVPSRAISVRRARIAPPGKTPLTAASLTAVHPLGAAASHGMSRTLSFKKKKLSTPLRLIFADRRAPVCVPVSRSVPARLPRRRRLKV
jgi:hypothetical protein